jgi:hypothetical protein
MGATVSDEDEKTFRVVALISVVSVFILLAAIVSGALYAEYECIELIRKGVALKEDAACGNGNLMKGILELVGLIVGVLAAIKVFLGKM